MSFGSIEDSTAKALLCYDHLKGRGSEDGGSLHRVYITECHNKNNHDDLRR